VKLINNKKVHAMGKGVILSQTKESENKFISNVYYALD
jgi:hypothetical protein